MIRRGYFNIYPFVRKGALYVFAPFGNYNAVAQIVKESRGIEVVPRINAVHIEVIELFSSPCSWTMAKVGLEISFEFIPSPSASPLTNAVFPIPSPPKRAIISFPIRREPILFPSASVSSGECVVTISAIRKDP